MVRTDTLAFPNIILLSKSYPMFWPSHLDLDNDNNGQRRKSFLGDASNFNMLQLNSLLPWKQFFLVGGWDSPLGHVTHPTLVQNGCHQC